MKLRLPRFRESVKALVKKGLTTREIAFGIAVGNFVGIMPLFGLHTLLGVAVAYVLRLNQLVVFLGAQISNPLTFPFILLLSAQIGSLILTGTLLDIKVHDVDVLSHYVAPLILGSLVLGVTVGCSSYVITTMFIKRYRS